MSPDGQTHLKLWQQFGIFATVIFLVISPVVQLLHNVLVCFGTFCMPISHFFFVGNLIGYFTVAYFIDPDADIVGMSSADGRMMNKIPILGVVLVAYWTVYGAIFRRKHRSFWTHSYIFSTFLRFIYGFWWIFPFFRELLVVYVFSGIFAGLCLSDAVHIWADRKYKEKK